VSRRNSTLWLILATAVPMFMVSLNNLVVTNALPVLSQELNAGPADLQWVIHAYSLPFAGLLLTGVGLGDRFGRRKLFVTGIGAFLVGSVLCGAADSLATMIVGRAVQGAGAALVFPLSLTLLAVGVADRRRTLAIGLWSAVNGLGIALGPLVGGAVMVRFGWEWIFWMTVPLSVVVGALALLVLNESRGERARLDFLGMVLASTAVVALVWGIIEAGGQGWTSTSALTGFAAAAVLAILFARYERGVESPLLPLRLYRNRPFAIANAVTFAMFFGVFGSLYWLMQYLQIVLGYSPLEAGIRTLPWTAMPMLVALVVSLLVARIDAGRLIAAGMLLEAGALAWSAALLGTDVSYGRIVPALLLGGIGMGLIFAPLTEAVLVAVRREDRGKASGANTTVREIGFALGVAVLTTVVTRPGAALTSSSAFVDAVRPALWLGAAAVLVGSLAAFRLTHARATSTEGHAVPVPARSHA
jgi:EmrB/QacA subfamily drug resistance transporter